jgi:hypothetical protein
VFHSITTVAPAATVAVAWAFVADLWQMMSPPAYASGATNPKSVADWVHPIDAGGSVIYGYWLTR